MAVKNARRIAFSLMTVLAFAFGCKAEFSASNNRAADQEAAKLGEDIDNETGQRAAKLTSGEWIDPDLAKMAKGVTLMLCDGTLAEGSLDISLLKPENIRSGIEVAGVKGALSETLATCTSDGEVGCVTTTTYKAISNTANLTAGNIKLGVVIGGVTGTYTAVGAGTLDPWDLRVGVDGTGITVGDAPGQLKVNCRNMVGHYDGAGGHTGGSTALHTVDDYNYDGAASGGFPTMNPWGTGEHLCGYSSIPAAERTWERVVTTPVTSGANSVYKDKISGLLWSQGDVADTAKGWDEAAGGAGNGAVEYCNQLDHGGYAIGRWRLPTQKELMDAYAHGIHDLDDDHTATDNLGNLDQEFWSASTRSSITSSVWYVALHAGTTSFHIKPTSHRVLCVRA